MGSRHQDVCARLQRDDGIRTFRASPHITYEPPTFEASPLPHSPVMTSDRLPLFDTDTGFEHEPPFQGQGAHLAVTGQGAQDSDSWHSGIDDEANQPDPDMQFIMSLPPNTYNPNGTNTFYTVFLIVNAALGAGLLNFPKAFDDAGGVGVAVSVQALLMFFIVLALLILAFTADQNLANTIQEAMEGAAGIWGRRVTSLIVVLYTFGTTITFIIIIGDQFDRGLASLVGPDFCHHWYMDRRFTMTFSSVLLILPMCYSKRIDFLRIPSTVGVIAILYIVGLVVYEYFFGDFEPGPIKTSPTQWTDVFLVVPDICFGYQCHVSVIPIYSCMKHRTLKQFSIASISAIIICAFCYTVAATFGYLTFGSFVDDDILMSYTASRPEVFVAIFAMALKTFTTYPILLFCGREAIKSLVSDFYSLSERQEFILRVSLVTVWFFLSLILAVVIPNIGDIIKILGSLAAVFIFTLPGLGLFQYAHRSDPSCFLLRTKVFMVTSFVFSFLGAFIFGVVLTQGIQYNMMDTGLGPKPLCF